MIENERKFVLKNVGRAEADMTRAAIKDPSIKVFDILQGYVDKHLRIRRFTPLSLQAGPTGISFVEGSPHYVFSYKRSFGPASLEKESPMDQREFDRWWQMIEVSLTKRRFAMPGSEVSWDVDFLKGPTGTYFSIAEVEMPEGMDMPPSIHPLVRRHVAYLVGRGEKGFGNRRLAEINYAQDLLRQLVTEPEAPAA